MNLTTEIVEEKQNALIVSNKGYSFMSLLKNEFKRVSISPFSSPFIPKKGISICFDNCSSCSYAAGLQVSVCITATFIPLFL